VRISGDGRVSWLGEKSVELKGSAEESIPSIDARVLMQRVADRGFWALCGRYSRSTPDAATFYTTLSIAGHLKRVEDNAAAAPSWLRMMDDEIDLVADTHRWRHGEPDKETFANDRLKVDVSSPKTGVTRLMKLAAQPDSAQFRDMVADSSLDLNARDSSGWTALMYASQAGSLEQVSLLLHARANPSLYSNEGETAIFAAVSSSDRPDLKVRLLYSAGADINWQDNRGVTPLMIAARHAAMPNLIATLIQLGADPAKRDIDGYIAADYLREEEKIRPDPSNSHAIKALLVSGDNPSRETKP
jgi:hypothetical protein